MDEATLVAFGGLLHDIGKFVQRANWDEKRNHEEWGYEFLYAFKDKNPLFEKLATFARFHHRESLEKVSIEDVRMLNLLWIVYEADNLSSKERTGEKPQFGNPLLSIFSSIHLGKGDPKRYYYGLREYDPNTFFYPVEFANVNKRDYAKLLNGFRDEFMKIVERLDFNRMLSLLEKYTTFIPSVMSGEDEVSLYDHLKTTSAIALCLYHYHREELDRDVKERILDRKEFKYLLIGGDFSGIQDFIYTISSKGALKYLRARSAFLELLSEDVVEEIVRRLNLTRANVIYCGGGHFYILAPNTEKVKEELEKIAEAVNRWLFDKYHGKLYLALDYIELNGECFENLEINGKSIWKEIWRKLKIRKNRKFLEILRDCKVEKDYWKNVCDVCGSPTDKPYSEDDLSVCKSCQELLNLGRYLPRMVVFVRWKHDKVLVDQYPAVTLPFSTFYGLYEHETISIEKMLEQFPKDAVVYVKNSFGLEDVYRGYVTIPYFLSDYAVRNENGEIKNFDELGKSAKGVEKIAVLKMDVDDLGRIFSEGLPKGRRTLSRYATLSRFMNHFFKNCIRLIAKRDGIFLDRKLPKIFEGDNERNVVVVYSGGDDLFIVGSWNDVFEIAFEIREAFGEYVGWNPNLTISAGFAIFDPKYPLYRMVKITSDRLENAKDEGKEISEDIKIKDRIMLFERSKPKEFKETHKQSYTWEEFKNIWNKYISNIYEIISENGESVGELKISRVILRKILETREKYIMNPKGLSWHISLIYYLSRANLIDILGDLAKRDVVKVRSGEPQDIYFIDAPLRIIDLAVRG